MPSEFPGPVDTHARFTGLVAAAAMGVYLLLIVGATTAISDAATACTTWPACDGQWVVGLDDPLLLVAWGHRVAAMLVGGLVVAVAALAWLGETTRRVRWTLTAGLALYPVQIALGAVVATTGTTALTSAVHLLLGLSIFGVVVAALAWTLEDRTATPEDREPVTVDEPLPSDGTPTAHEVPEDPVERAKLTALAYLRLTKPRLMWLLVLVAVGAMALATTAGEPLDAADVAWTVAGGVLSIGASGTFNHVLERDIDRKMQRTADRPLAVDFVSVRNAVAFGLGLAALSISAFLQLNLLAAALGAVAIVFYSVVYTLLLKPNTVQNTVIGGAAGALPALIGWAAVTGTIGAPGIALAGLIFLWTPAHFYNLALAYKEDYARGDFPMMPNVRGEATTRRHIVWYFALTLGSAAVLSALTELGLAFALTSVLLGTVFLWAIVRLHREQTEAAAFRAFHASNAYLGTILLAIVVDALVV